MDVNDTQASLNNQPEINSLVEEYERISSESSEFTSEYIFLISEQFRDFEK